MNTKLNELLNAAEITGTSALLQCQEEIREHHQKTWTECVPLLPSRERYIALWTENKKQVLLADITIYKMYLYCVFCILFTCIIQFWNCNCTFVCV